MSYKACSRCGRIHSTKYRCNVNRVFSGGAERDFRSSSAWTKKSIEIREKAMYLCEVCKDRGTLTYKSLEVHHINKIKDDEVGALDNLNLICLCKQHHEDAEKGILDKEYLRSLAMGRESN